jgi:hypothetical protein
MSHIGGYMALLHTLIAKLTANYSADFTYIYSPSKSKNTQSDDTDFGIGRYKVYCLICISFALLILIIRLQNEKYSRIRSFMRMMGMNDRSYYISHFVFFAVYSFAVAVFMTAFGKALFLKKVNVLIIFVQCYLMLMSVFFFALLTK